MEPQNVRANPQEILFSISTLNDALPAARMDIAVDANVVVLHEDDWRQFELISSSHHSAILEDLKAIDDIWQSYSVPLGRGTAFRQLHIRKQITQPLNGEVANDSLGPIFPKDLRYLSFQGWPHPAANVIGGAAGGFVLYAAFDQSTVHCIGLQHVSPNPMTLETAMNLIALIRSHNLRLVHWPSRTLFPSTEAVEKYLTGTT